jgi:hypothetical protein
VAQVQGFAEPMFDCFAQLFRAERSELPGVPSKTALQVLGLRRYAVADCILKLLLTHFA